MNNITRNKELSWLSFNERLLQEASKKEVPLIERLKFLGIYSNNLDEFFRIKVAILRRLATIDNLVLADGELPAAILDRIEQTVVAQSQWFERIYGQLLKDLAEEDIFIINENQLTPEQGSYVTAFFKEEVRPRIMPVIIKKNQPLPSLNDDAIYLAVVMTKSKKEEYALIEVPTDLLPRFVILPSDDDKRHIILLEDVIRYELKDIFYMFSFKTINSYIVKLTRDAELDLDDDVAEGYVKILSKSLEKRGNSELVRFVHDKEIPENFLALLLKKLNFDRDDVIIGGSRIHNFKDFMGFPSIGKKHLYYKTYSPLPHPNIHQGEPFLSAIAKKDILLHFPYQSFYHFIDLLREASIDPKVTEIKMTAYRMAKNSNVIHALINAARNGKKVTVVLELRARFNEQDNIQWGNLLTREGVKVILGVPGLKVHSKLCLISRKEEKEVINYACIGTGNFNEITSKVFSDQMLWTANPAITKEVSKVFEFFSKNYKIGRYHHLLVSPFTMRYKMIQMIRQEIQAAKNGKKAAISIKCNNLVDLEIIAKLCDAAKAGVDVRINVRGMLAIIPISVEENYSIPSIGIIDRYLEHSRIYYFYAGGKENMFISSADLMTRNLDRRVEVSVPIYDPEMKKELLGFLDLQWKDNTSARILDNGLSNQINNQGTLPLLTSQLAFYDFLQSYREEK
ncbi:MAG: polyphosphate kinase 1 [Prolixibacteraceae bacterium]|jgi:polyphosphate kinase|nr:polyphosphate kinase 1 [Prolixibacteraceae bacterium]